MAYKTVNKVFVGADINRTAGATNGVTDLNIATLLDEGEVILLDVDKQPLAALPDITDSTTIYIAVGTANTFVGEDGLNYREVIVSDPISAIQGNILLYRATAYEARVEKTSTTDFGTFAPVEGEEYVIRIVYKDMYEHPGMYSQTYRYIAQVGDVLADVVNAFVARINGDQKSRVIASNVAGDLVLVSKHVPSNDIKHSIDEYRMVEFEVFLFSDNFDGNLGTTYTPQVRGVGMPGLVRDAEKKGLSHRGITNRTQFPVPQAVSNLTVDMDTTYNLIQIHYAKPYMSANNQFIEKTVTSVELYTPVSALGQTNNILADLDSWMVSAGMPTQAAAW